MIKKEPFSTKALQTMDDESLWDAYVNSQSIQIRNIIVERYASLVKYIAGRLAINMPPSVEYDDLVSYGTIGLIDAINKFDPGKGFKFKTYAGTRVRGAIIDHLRAQDWVPRSTRYKAKQVHSVYATLENRFGRSAADDEVAKEMNISIEDLHKLLLEISGTTVISIDDVWKGSDEEDEISILSTLEGPQDQHPTYKIEREEVKRVLVETIKSLPQREKEIIALYYYEELTLKEIGEVLGVTESRISQLHSKAILKLKAKLRKERECFS